MVKKKKKTPKKAPQKKKPRAAVDFFPPRDEALLQEMRVASLLLDAFGITLYGFSPGVQAFKKEDPLHTYSFEEHVWQWLKPLLEELLVARRDIKALENQLDCYHDDWVDRQRR